MKEGWRNLIQPRRILVKAVLSLESNVNNALLPIKSITEAYNADRPEKYHISSVGMEKAAGTGLQKKRESYGMCIVWNDEQLKILSETTTYTPLKS